MKLSRQERKVLSGILARARARKKKLSKERRRSPLAQRKE